uniref:hypothetical protein n=1 Tax=Hymenobacter sp. TaxID=1898978 RepID=UPI00286A5A3E
LSLRSAQPLAAATPTTATRAQIVGSALHLRTLLLGGLAVVASGGTALAQDAPSVKAKQADAQSLWLTVENPTHQLMQLKVVSLASHTCLVNEANRQPSYGSQLNFRGMPAGKYAVLLRVGRERYRYNVEVQPQPQPQTTILVRELTPAPAPDAVASTTR